MSDSKQDVLDMLHELAELTALDEGARQSFRVRAYENAASAIASQGADLGRMNAAELQKIEGVGKAIADKIRQLIETGKVDKVEALRRKYPATLVELMKLPGLGPKAVQRLQAELSVRSLDDLRKALAAHRVRALPGFGEKSEEKLLHAIERLDSEGGAERKPISVALPVARRVVERMLEVPGTTHASWCGSLRRFSETVGDIDVVVTAPDPVPVMEALVSMTTVDRVLARGDVMTRVMTRRGLQVDVRVVAPNQLGAALIYFTGSKAHNIRLRQRALARGWTLNEYALSEVDGGKVVASETEQQIYAALGLAWIPPVLREGGGEIEAAEKGTLPRALGQVVGDFHVHTTVSRDGMSPLEDVVSAARQRGYQVLAITDHAEGTLAGVDRQAMLDQRAHIRALQKQIGPDLTLLHGAELNIGPKGELDYDAEFRGLFDFCLASVHDHFELDRAAQTKRIVTAMQDPSVRMIGHLSARMIGARPAIELDLDAIFAAAEDTGVALEINGGLPRLDLSVEALRHIGGRKVTLVLTSDAHRADELDRVQNAALNAERAWVDPERVINAGDAERLIRWVQKRSSSREPT